MTNIQTWLLIVALLVGPSIVGLLIAKLSHEKPADPEPTPTVKELDDELWHADPDCKHDIYSPPGGGIKCRKCAGWFCY